MVKCWRNKVKSAFLTRLLDRRPDLAGALDVHGRPNGDELGFHGRLLGAVGVFQHKSLANPQDLAVNLVNVLAAVVLDPEVLADRK
jgi:hypothetical protein